MAACDRTILVIDDAVCGRAESYQHLLEQHRDPAYQVIQEQYDGPILERCRTDAVDGIILVLHTPELRGLDLLAHLQAQLGDGCPPIIVIGANDASLARRAFKAGAADYLIREQVTADTLHQALHSAIPTGTQATTASPTGLSLEECYQNLVTAIDEGFCICQMLLNEAGAPVDYRFLEINPSFEALTGLRQPVGKTARELVPDLEEIWFETYGRVALAREPIRFEQQSIPMQRWFHVYAFPMGEPQHHLFGILFQNITARKVMEQEREQFLAVGSDLQVIVGRDKYFHWVSPAFEQVLGWSVNEATARPWTEFVHPDDVDSFVRETEALFSGRQTFALENRYRHKDGSYRWLLWRAQVASAQQVVYGAAVDITESKRHAANTAFLADIATALSRLSSADDIMQTIGAKIGTYLNLAICAFTEIDAAEAEAIVHYAWHAEDASDVVGTYHIADFVTDDFRRAAHNRETVVVRDTATDPRTDRERYAALNISSFVSVPFHQDGQWKFLLNVYDSVPHNWREDEIELIRELANQIFPRLEWARTEAALRESEARFKGFAENSNDVIWITDIRHNRLVYVSPSYEQVWGRSPTEIYRDLSQFVASIHPDDRDRVLTGFQQWSERSLVQEYRIMRPDGTIVWISDRGFPIYNDQGEVWWIGGIAEDISDRKNSEAERKQAEEELRESERRFRRLVESNMFGVAFGNFSGEIHYVNNYFLDMLGYTQAELEAGQVKWTAITPPEFLHLDQQAIEELKINGVATPFEKEYIRKDGSRIPILIGAALLQEPYDQHQEMIAFYLDLSDRKQAENAILQLNQQLQEKVTELQTLLNVIPIGIGIAEDRECRYIRANPAFAQLLNLPPTVNASLSAPQEERPTNFKVYQNGQEMAPEDLPLQYVATHGVEVHDLEVEVVWQDGTVVSLLEYAAPLFDESGQIRGSVGAFLDITERKQAEIALREREQRLDLATRAAKLGVFEWNIQADSAIWENAQMYDIFGHTLEDDTLNKAASINDVIHPDDREEFARCLAEGMKNGHFHGICRIRRRHDGQWRWVESSGQFELAADGTPRRLVGVLSDITERKRSEVERQQTEAALRNSAERLSLALMAAKLGDWSWDAATDIVTFSEQAAAMFGIPPGPHMTWTDMRHLLHPDDREPARLQVEQAIANHSEYDIEYRVMSGDHQLRWIAAKGRAQYDSSGQVLGMLGVLQDITSRKQIEQEREQLLTSERIARSQAEAANRVKDEFLAVVSHELRSPLNPILGWSKLLRRGQLDEQKTQHALEVIERNTQIQAQLINDLLDVSSILRGKLSLNKRAVNLQTVIQAALETVQLAAEAKSIQIHTVIESDMGTVSGDSDRLQQVAWNLLSNAVKFTPEGGRVEVRLEQVEATSQHRSWSTSAPASRQAPAHPPTPQPAYAQLTITDTGRGIHPDFLPYVFDRFRQESTATTRQFGGLGLGLALVRYLVELHGGSVQADSAGEEQGSTFTVQLPLLSHTPATDQEPERPEPSTDLSNLQILVVDDDTSTREFLVFLLELHGARVIAAASAAEAIAMLAQFTPNILLSDIGMPDMDGYMLMRRLRSLLPAQGARIPAIALTAYAGEIDHQQAIAAGFQKHVTKPVEPDLLIAAIAELIKQADNIGSN